MLIFTVDNQNLYLFKAETVVADKIIQFVKLKFEFSPEWAGFSKVCQLHRDSSTYSVLLEDDNTCYLPAEITAGWWSVGVFGQKAGLPDRATTAGCRIQVLESGFFSTAETPVPPTPDLYSQLLQDIANYYTMMTEITLFVNVVDGTLNLYSEYPESPIDISMTDGVLEVWKS